MGCVYAMNQRATLILPRQFTTLVPALVALTLSSVAPDALAQPAAESQTATAIVLGREGKVDAAAKGSATWTAVVTNQALNTGDRLRTGLRSRATVRWSDLSAPKRIHA